MLLRRQTVSSEICRVASFVKAQQGRFCAFFSLFWRDVRQIGVFSGLPTQFGGFSGKWLLFCNILAEFYVPDV
jgi:hypothetical protein